jgi:hypothetical protein
MAALALSAVACIILPARVRRKKAAKITITTSAPMRTAICCGMIIIEPTRIGSDEVSGGKER